jgi:hypothetical protein
MGQSREGQIATERFGQSSRLGYTDTRTHGHTPGDDQCRNDLPKIQWPPSTEGMFSQMMPEYHPITDASTHEEADTLIVPRALELVDE